MVDSNETTAYENGRDVGYAEGYEDGLRNRNGFTEDDFSETELKVLRLAFRLADSVIEIQRTSNYDTDDCNALFNLKEKLKINGIV